MNSGFMRLAELDCTSWPEVRDRILRFDHEEFPFEPRTYPGYPRWPLPRKKGRLWPGLERVLTWRRCWRKLSPQVPRPNVLGRLTHFSHGIMAAQGRGPVPSAGGLQALELYVVLWETSWLPQGLYHYDRSGHALEQLGAHAARTRWQEIVPSLPLVEGGSLLWVVVGAGTRVEKKYGPRGLRFLLLEAGHLMQNLCLVSASLGWATIPLGGFFEQEVVQELSLPAGDVVLYTGICGKPEV